MTWNRTAAAAALGVALQPAVDAGATYLPHPPGSFNPPAILAQYPTSVALHTPTFAVDLADWNITAVVGIDQGDTLEDLLGVVTSCIESDPTLGNAVQVAQVAEWRNWRILGVSGADYLAADVVLSVRM